jgi:predicted XRE-type DNA-binding protein
MKTTMKGKRTTERAKTRAASAGSVMRSSGNVFADLGLPHPEERLTKAQLAHAIARVIAQRGLTQRVAAALMGIDQPKVSHVLRGQLADFSTERLVSFLTDLGQDVEIVVKTAPRSRKQGRIRVVAA